MPVAQKKAHGPAPAPDTLIQLGSRLPYEFASLISSTIHGLPGFFDDTFAHLFEGPEKAVRPHKDTLLHDVIRNLIFHVLEYSTGHFPEEQIDYYRSILAEARMTAPRWLRPDRVEHHIHTLDRLLFQAVEAIAPSVFYLLFSDRQIMIAFQKRVAAYLSTLKRDELPGLLVRDGVLKRTPPPAWLKAGVVFRDHGRCQGCRKDLAVGLLGPVNDRHFDHIIPLAMSGSNDPTNFQLLCTECNLRKGRRDLNERPKFAPYW